MSPQPCNTLESNLTIVPVAIDFCVSYDGFPVSQYHSVYTRKRTMNFSGPSIRAPGCICRTLHPEMESNFPPIESGLAMWLASAMGHYHIWHKERFQKHLCTRACFLCSPWIPPCLNGNKLRSERHNPVTPVATATAIQPLEAEPLGSRGPTADTWVNLTETGRRTAQLNPTQVTNPQTYELSKWLVYQAPVFCSDLLCSNG